MINESTQEHALVRVDSTGGVFIDGSEVFVGGENELVEEVASLVDSDEKHLVITPNVDQILELRRSSSWRMAFHSASLRIADGAPLVFLARALGARKAQRNTGADLLPRIVAESVTRGWRIVLTGGSSEVLNEAVSRLRSENPGAEVFSAGFPMVRHVGDPASASVVSELAELRPDMVFVCLGSPKQELWIHEWFEVLPNAVYVGAGAAVDFAAGSIQRAPAVLQRIGMEWSWRLMQEPSRLAHRYLVRGPQFLSVMRRSLAHAFGRLR